MVCDARGLRAGSVLRVVTQGVVIALKISIKINAFRSPIGRFSSVLHRDINEYHFFIHPRRSSSWSL